MSALPTILTLTEKYRLFCKTISCHQPSSYNDSHKALRRFLTKLNESYKLSRITSNQNNNRFRKANLQLMRFLVVLLKREFFSL